MDVLPMCSIFQELQIVHDTGYFSALPSLEEYWQQVNMSACLSHLLPVSDSEKADEVAADAGAVVPVSSWLRTRIEVCGSEVDQCVSLTAGAAASAAHAGTGNRGLLRPGSAAGSRPSHIMWRNVAIFNHFPACLAIFLAQFAAPSVGKKKSNKQQKKPPLWI